MPVWIVVHAWECALMLCVLRPSCVLYINVLMYVCVRGMPLVTVPLMGVSLPQTLLLHFVN